jgi:NADPH:quinone reductase-like Zn-dependent oxidoreductase
MGRRMPSTTATEDFVARVKDITGGKGVKVVYDSVGKDTWDKSLDCLRPFGLMASFGNASGPVPPFAPGHAGRQGLDVRDAPDPVQPHRHARGTRPWPTTCSPWCSAAR